MKNSITKFTATLVLVIIAHIATAQVDVMKFLVAKQVQEVALADITIIPSSHTDEIGDQLLAEYEKSGHDSIKGVMDKNYDATLTWNVGLDVIAMKEQSEIINALAREQTPVFKKYDDIRKASIAVRQAEDGTYIVLIASHL